MDYMYFSFIAQSIYRYEECELVYKVNKAPKSPVIHHDLCTKSIARYGILESTYVL